MEKLAVFSQKLKVSEKITLLYFSTVNSIFGVVSKNFKNLWLRLEKVVLFYRKMTSKFSYGLVRLQTLGAHTPCPPEALERMFPPGSHFYSRGL